MEPKFDREMTEIGYPSGGPFLSNFCNFCFCFGTALGPKTLRSCTNKPYGVPQGTILEPRGAILDSRGA